MLSNKNEIYVKFPYHIQNIMQRQTADTDSFPISSLIPLDDLGDIDELNELDEIPPAQEVTPVITVQPVEPVQLVYHLRQ